MGKFINLKGSRFGRLTVLERAKNGNCRQVRWLCKCDCGNLHYASTAVLRAGKVQSCGCLIRDVHSTHGMSGTRLYKIWDGMKCRCYSKSHMHYDKYGGRGIKICQEWRENPASFCEWAMANGYKDDLTIDRINHDGDYEPNNCRWITNAKQQTNKRNNRMITYKGKTQCVADWIRELNLDKARTYNRIANGWTEVEEIFFSDRDKRKERYYG